MDRTHLPLVTIFGGSGFLGTQIVQILGRRDFRVRVAVRRPDLAIHLRPLAAVGQIVPVQANLRFPHSVAHAVKGADMVINLVGLGNERGRQTFSAVNVEGARIVAEAARREGVRTLVQLSALGADTESPSAYARSKAEGDRAVLAAFPDAVILRPSILFGRDDTFFNLMGTLARYFPVLPLIGGESRFQPAFVGDVAEAAGAAAEAKVAGGRIYELGGPEIVTHRELLRRILKETNRHNPLLPVPAGLAKLLALPFAILPFPPLLTADQVELLGRDNVVSESAIAEKRTFEAFGIAPTPMSTILPSYLWRFRRNGQFDRHTSHDSEGTRA